MVLAEPVQRDDEGEVLMLAGWVDEAPAVSAPSRALDTKLPLSTGPGSTSGMVPGSPLRVERRLHPRPPREDALLHAVRGTGDEDGARGRPPRVGACVCSARAECDTPVEELAPDPRNGYPDLVLPALLLPTVLALGPAVPADVLHAWDERRADAWAAGDVAGLRSLYTTGSVAGRRDTAMLRAWSLRGLRVNGLRMQLLRVDVRAHTPTRLVLDVTDRVAGGVAVPGPVALPRDAATRHVVTLRRVAGEWRVSAVLSRARPG
jgi:hypothetical protein